MRRLVVASDSHGRCDLLKLIAEKEKADYYFLCGDSEAEEALIYPFTSVKGNMDYYNYPLIIISNIGKYKILMTHGHVLSEITLKYKVKEENINIVLLGHTHNVFNEIIDGCLYLNPGSVSRPRGLGTRGYMVLELDEDSNDITKIKVNRKSLEDLL